MMPRKAILVLLVLAIAGAPVTLGNPTDPTEIPELEKEIRRVIRTHGRSGCQRLPELLSRVGFNILRAETLPLIRENMIYLEPCIIESQWLAGTLDPRIHREFLAYASASGIASMKEVLRGRLVLPPQLLALQDSSTYASRPARQDAEITTRRLIQTAELLADYRDKAAIPQIETLLATLTQTPAESLWSRYVEPPSWFLRMALGRLEDPEFGAVLVPSGDGKWQFARDESEIARVEIQSCSSTGSARRPIELPSSLVLDMLARLTASEMINPQGMSFGPLVRIRIYLTDGVTATLYSMDRGCVMFEDNTRESDNPIHFLNPSLAASMLDLFRTLAMEGSKIAGQ
jgi:hypothetical protein